MKVAWGYSEELATTNKTGVDLTFFSTTSYIHSIIQQNFNPVNASLDRWHFYIPELVINEECPPVRAGILSCSAPSWVRNNCL